MHVVWANKYLIILHVCMSKPHPYYMKLQSTLFHVFLAHRFFPLCDISFFFQEYYSKQNKKIMIHKGLLCIQMKDLEDFRRSISCLLSNLRVCLILYS